MKHYIFIVDSHCPHKHKTAGTYVVFAKNPKVGRQILKSVIKFGRIQFWSEYEKDPEWNSVFPMNKGLLQIKNMLRNTCFKVNIKEVINGRIQTELLTATSDTACQHKHIKGVIEHGNEEKVSQRKTSQNNPRRIRRTRKKTL